MSTEMRSKWCDYCDGTGVVFEAYEHIDDYVEETCPWCKGTGINKPCEVEMPEPEEEK